MDFGMVRRQQLRMQARAIEQVAKQLNREPKEFHDNPDLLAEPEVKQLYEDAYQAAYLNEVKLYTLPEQYSKLVQAASQQAVEAVEVGMQNEQLSTYFRKLSAGDQAKMMAHMKAELFVDKYVKLTESSSEYVPLTSPEQPGRLQKWRMYGKLPNQPGRIGSLVNGTLRALEAPFRLTYGMGAEAWRHRTIPFAADATAAVKNKAKRLFLLMGASYWVNYYVWQTTFTWPQYLFLTGTFTLLSVAAYALDRMMMNIDKAPMDSTKRKIVYSIFWSTISFPLGFPFYFWAKPFTASWDKYVTTPIATALNTVVTTPIEHVITACEKLLGN